MTDNKEIGGYFEMEELPGEEYYPDLLRLNLGRTALLYLLKQRGCREIFLPHYLCDSVIGACRDSGIKISFYSVNDALEPGLEELPDGAWCYLVNYYGQLTDDRILFYQEKYQRIIVDQTHAFYQRPLPHVDTIYSPRKFFGLPDGAYLAADLPPAEELPPDYSAGRMEHILGRYEKGGNAYYQVMLKNAETFHTEKIRRMSRLTRNLLRGIDYSRCAEKRNENYSALASFLDSSNPLPFRKPSVPMCYPFYTEHGPEIRKQLALEKIYVPVYWKNVADEMPADSTEHRYAANILPLPCDQRYTPADMERVASAVLRLCGRTL